MHRRTGISLALIGLLCLAALAATAKPLDLKTLTGTWTCPICDQKKLEGKQAECEALGHEHALKLDDGTWVRFMETEKSGALIHGGGRHTARMKVCGFLDPNATTVDVECYEIDEKWTSWCPVHGRMDLCRGEGAEAGTAAETKTSK
jgi:hypothetical protein